MHIPDGYLSPETCIVMYGAAAPFWYQASRRVKKALSGRAAPLIAIFAAFSFTIQMFNIPVPPGTTAHAVGGTLMAIVLGPWAAIVGVSVALIIQAVFFGDGGITAIGANAFNIAVALPLSGYAVYALLSRGAAPGSRRRIVAAAAGGYVGINVAGLLAALELGLQPVFWSAGGRALYNPYGLAATIPAMAITHLTIAGFAEAALTALALSYLRRAHPALLIAPARARPTAGAGHAMGRVRWGLLAVLAMLVLLVPLGLLAPGSAAFEWAAKDLAGLVGYVPAGLAGLGALWQLAPLPGYQLPGLSGAASVLERAPGYIFSAAVGVGLIFTLAFAARIALSRHGPRPASGRREG